MRTRSQLTALKSEFDGFMYADDCWIVRLGRLPKEPPNHLPNLPRCSDHVRQNMQELHEQERTLPLEQLAAMFGQRNVQIFA